MNKRLTLSILSLGLLLTFLVAGIVLLCLHLPTTGGGLRASSLSLAQTSNMTDLFIDSRPCIQNPSSATCNGVLPYVPHNVLERAGGAGACFANEDGVLVEDQQITDGANSPIGTFDLWYSTSCQVYTAHVLYEPNTQQLHITVHVNQLNGNVITQALNSFTALTGAQDSPLISASQSTGDVSNGDVWTPMLYSPNAPIQATAMVGQGDNYQASSQSLLTMFYAAGQPTTVNNRAS